MKKLMMALVVLLVLVAGVAVLGWWMWTERGEDDNEWTTSSPRAAEELDAGLAAIHRHHWTAAAQHVYRAVELDPDFIVARYLQARYFLFDKNEKETTMAQVVALDQSELSDRERFLMSFWTAIDERDADTSEHLVDTYLADYPDDLFGIEALCDVHWVRQRWDEAMECYERLLALYPSRVHARLNRGYIELARGRFDDAEAEFEAYRFVAPDRPEPYQVLGKLDTVRGRYQEAAHHLAKSLEIDSTYCPAWVDLGYLQAHAGWLDQCEQTIARMIEVEECHWLQEHGQVCLLQVLAAYVSGDEERVLDRLETCVQGNRTSVLGYRVALASGRDDLATALETKLAGRLRSVEEAGFPAEASMLRGLELHYAAVKSFAAGDLDLAAEQFAAADAKLDYWGMSTWAFKLFNRLDWMTALSSDGRLEEAQTVLAEIEEVNPRYAEQMTIGSLDRLFPGSLP
ncbi:MAG: tetratricopeptide repeat protein [Acidobacteriota bacterium]